MPSSPSSSSTSTTKTSEPLRILFCGSDAFSCASLTALHDLHKAQPELIESIDVLVRPGKPGGRGLKRIAVGPLFHLAHALNLPLHQRDTFTGWDLPLPGRVTHPTTGQRTIHPHPSGKLTHRGHLPFNLVVAVSFGLFVPPRILFSLAYGGLNVHPSLLPDLRGPAPLQWTILADRPGAGVTLQTLHPTEYDQGHILARTPSPGLPIPPGCTTPQLLEMLAPAGAAMLADGLRQGLHVPPYPPPLDLPAFFSLPLRGGRGRGRGFRDAPKIRKADACIDWDSTVWAHDHALYTAGRWTASDLERRFRAVGHQPTGKTTGLWTYALARENPHEERVILEDVEAIPCPAVLRNAVMTIVQHKHDRDAAAAAGRKGNRPDEGARRAELPAQIVNVCFSTKNELGGREIRLPVLVEEERQQKGQGTSVVIPIRVPYRLAGGEATALSGSGTEEYTAIRVKIIKNEGEVGKPASRALERFMEKRLTVEEVTNLDYAIDVMTTREE